MTRFATIGQLEGDEMIGQTVEVDGRKRWVAVAGTGSPSVLFEAALGDVGLTWGLVHPMVAATTTTFAYDRAGMGRSDRSGTRRDPDTMVQELRATIAAIGLRPPHVLVGHSFASLLVRVFAALHPDEVAGLVLVDGAHEDQMERFPAELDSAGMLEAVGPRLRGLAAAVGQGEPMPALTPIPGSFPPPLAAEYRDATKPTVARLETAAEEYESLPVFQSRMRRLVPAVSRDVPLIVIRHGIPQPMPGVADEVNDRYESTWKELQEELAARSTAGEVRVAQGAGHLIHHETPDVVAAAIGDLIARLRGST